MLFESDNSPFEGEEEILADNNDESTELLPDDELEQDSDNQEEVVDEPVYEVDIDGNKEMIPQSRLIDMMNKTKQLEEIEPEIARYQELKPILNKIGGSNMLRNAVTYSMQGYSDDQIIEGLFLLKHPEVKEMYDNYAKNKPTTVEEEPEFDTIEEEVAYKVKKGIEEHLAPIKEQLSSMSNKEQQAQQYYQAQQIFENNDRLINSLVERHYGSIEVNNENITKLQNAFVKLGYGRTGADISRVALNEDQAEALLYKAYGTPKTRQQAPSLLNKTADLPNIMRGTPGKAMIGGEGKSQNTYSNTVARKKAVDEIWDRL